MQEKSSGVVYFANSISNAVFPIRPLRVVFLTSVRDVGESDLNGLFFESTKYMKGVIEHTVQQTLIGGALSGLVEIVGVFTDDLEKDMSRYPVCPTEGEPWIFPYDFRLHDGDLLRERTFHIPSSFRVLPLADVEGRRREKMSFEKVVHKKMMELGADILISDHYMARIDYLIGELGLFGKVLNIHPAVTVQDSPFCFRGKTPTADAIQAARSGEVFTGATLHFVDKVIDDGQIIAYCASTPVYASDKPQHLRYRNYRKAKLPLFIDGLKHYVLRIFPYIDEIDINKMVPLT